MTQPFFAKKKRVCMMRLLCSLWKILVVYTSLMRIFWLGLSLEKDLLKGALADADTKATPIATIMTRMPNLVTVTKNDTVLHAAEQLVFHQIDSLPVLENTKVVGKISKTRITALFVDTIKKV